MHTPTPWKVNEQVTPSGYVISGVGKFMRKADANFAAMTANAHEDLIAAIEKTLRFLDVYGQNEFELKRILNEALAKAGVKV